MKIRSKVLLAISPAVGSLLFSTLPVAVAVEPTTPSFASNDRIVWNQDFQDMTSDSQLGIGSYSIPSGGNWMAHYPGGDNADFINPQGHDIPFGIDGSGAGSNYLTIRTQQGYTSNNYTGNFSEGALSSTDYSGNGFTQEYGYFEASMYAPHDSSKPNNDDANTWPAFWLVSPTKHTEIDVTEMFGNAGTGPNQSPAGNPNISLMTVHDYGQGTETDSTVADPTLTTGFHLYGVDIEPTGITFYLDRKEVWFTPFIADAATPFSVLIDNALGGGNYNNSDGTGYNFGLTTNNTDLQVQYVTVWASPSSPNYVPEPGAVILLLGGLPLLSRRPRRSVRPASELRAIGDC